MAGKRRADGPATSRRSEGWWPPAFLRRNRDGEREPKGPKTWKTRLKKFFIWSTVTGLVLALLAVAGFVYLYKTTDIPEPNAEFLTNATYVYYDDGETELGRYATQFRDSVPLDEMSDYLTDAVVAAEDQSFWTNNGIDPKGIVRGGLQQRQRQLDPGRVDDHPAVREDPLPDPGAVLQAQGQGSDPVAEDPA